MIRQASQDDARVPRVVRALREHSVDELRSVAQRPRAETLLVELHPHALGCDTERSCAIACSAARQRTTGNYKLFAD
jgi:hypothetical protein